MSRARHFKKGGGVKPSVVSGNPNVLKEARARKNGGAVKDAATVLRMAGGAVAKRFDRPGRKRGGGVGANTSPLSTAHRETD
jgi:hypothetical protein